MHIGIFTNLRMRCKYSVILLKLQAFYEFFLENYPFSKLFSLMEHKVV